MLKTESTAPVHNYTAGTKDSNAHERCDLLGKSPPLTAHIIPEQLGGCFLLGSVSGENMPSVRNSSNARRSAITPCSNAAG